MLNKDLYSLGGIQGIGWMKIAFNQIRIELVLCFFIIAILSTSLGSLLAYAKQIEQLGAFCCGSNCPSGSICLCCGIGCQPGSTCISGLELNETIAGVEEEQQMTSCRQQGGIPTIGGRQCIMPDQLPEYAGCINSGGTYRNGFCEIDNSSLWEGSISGTIFNDLNDNGNIDPGENGLAYWAVNLETKERTIIATTITAMDGSYSFANLAPGDYYISEVLPPGWEPISPVENWMAVSFNNEKVNCVNFANEQNSANEFIGIGNRNQNNEDIF